jgi:hypothetical protein
MSPKLYKKQQRMTIRNSKSTRGIRSSTLLGLVRKNWGLLLSIPPFLPHEQEATPGRSDENYFTNTLPRSPLKYSGA